MTFQLVNQIAEAFYQLFGGSILLIFIIISLVAMLVLSIKGGKIVFMLILIPMITVLFTVGTSKFFQGVGVDTQWVPVVGWMVMGLIMATVFWKIIQN